jgi:probable rRNA maturation factor
MKKESKSAPPQVTVRNLQRNVPVNTDALKKFAAPLLRACLQLRKNKATDLTKLAEIFILFVSDRRMASLHRKFLNQSGTTDVLTFQHGEIFISAETASRNARAFGNSLSRELQLYIVHGLLHLHGFEDRSESGAQKMERMQERILGQATL